MRLVEMLEKSRDAFRGLPAQLRKHKAILVLLLSLPISILLYERSSADEPPDVAFHNPIIITQNSASDIHPQIATDGQGRCIAVWASRQSTYRHNNATKDVGADYDIWVAYSEDNGTSWTDSRPLNINAAIASEAGDHKPQIATDKKGNWVVVWHSYDPHESVRIPDADILVSHSGDDGRNWTEPKPLNSFAASDTSFATGIPILNHDKYPHIAYGDGKWMAVWQSNYDLNGAGRDDDIMWSISVNNGRSWSPAQVIKNAHSDRYSDSEPYVTFRPGYDTTTKTDNRSHHVYPSWLVTWHRTSAIPRVHTIFSSIKEIMTVRYSYSPQRLTEFGLIPGGYHWNPATSLEKQYIKDEIKEEEEGYQTQVACSNQHCIVVWQSCDGYCTVGKESKILMARSSDGGASWTEPQVLQSYMSSDDSENAHPQISTDGKRHWLAIWQSTRQIEGCGDTGFKIGRDSDIFIATSTNNGATWSCSTSVKSLQDSLQNNTLPFLLSQPDLGNAQPVEQPTSGIALPIEQPMMAELSPGADLFEGLPLIPTVPDLEDYFPQVATDQNGNWVAIWQSSEEGSDAEIKVATAVPPIVTSVSRLDKNPTNAETVRFKVQFSKYVSGGVDTSDFSLKVTGNIEGASVSSISGRGSRRTVIVNTGVGVGSIKLLVLDDDSINSHGNSLGGWGKGNGEFTGGPAYTIDDPPVASIERDSPESPTISSTIFYRVNFSEAVSGVGADDFDLATTGSISGTTVSSVSGSGAAYIVEIETVSGSGTIKLELADHDTIMGLNSHPLGGWGQNNGSVFTAPTFIVDRSEPEVANAIVSSAAGPYTNDNKELVFSWQDFRDPETDIVDYEVAFGDVDDPEAYLDFISVGLMTTKKFVPNDLSGHFPDGIFPEGSYIFTVRAINDVGLVSGEISTDVIVDTTAFKVGEELPLPDGKEWSDIDWDRTRATFTPTTHVVLIERAHRLLVGDWGSSIEIKWYFSGNTGDEHDLKRNYNTASETAWDPVIIYATHDGATSTIAPSVSLKDFNVTIHYNKTIPDVPYDNSSKPDTRRLWRDGESLYAREGMKEFAFVLLEYTDIPNPENKEPQEFIEILQVKPHNRTDSPNGKVHVGSRLFPARSMTDTVPFVTRGGGGSSPQYIYQHRVENSPQSEQIWTIHPNNDSYNMEVIWLRPGLKGVMWPFELRRYTSQWPEDAPAKYQLYVRGEEGNLGPKVEIPDELHAELFYEEITSGHAHLEQGGALFHSDAPGWALLKYATGPTPGQDWIGFEVVRCVDRHDPLVVDYDGSNLAETLWDIGTEITDDYHEGAMPGYIYEPEGDRYAPEIYADTGQIFAVNTGTLEVWWSNLSRIEDPEGGTWSAWPSERIQWPSKVVRYKTGWPPDPVNPEDWDDLVQLGKIIIARQNGSGAINPDNYGTDWGIYAKNDSTQPGFNPNDEHALTAQIGTGMGIFALRNDLGAPDTSEPYVLMKYKEQPENNLWRFRLFKVVSEEAPYFFEDWVGIERPLDPYEGEAGLSIQAPPPMPKYCNKTEAVSGPVFEDRSGDYWVKAAGDDGGAAEITMRYHYEMGIGFYPDEAHGGPAVGECIPWLDKGSGTPVDVTYTVYWPEDVPVMQIGQTLIETMNGLPDIQEQKSVDIIYQQSEASGIGQSVILIDPIQTREVELTRVPNDILTEPKGTEEIFTDLSLALRMRISYDSVNSKLKFKGVRIDPVTGFAYALLNVISNRERDELLALSHDVNWQNAVNSLYEKAKNPITIADSSIDPYDMLALTSGFAQGTGYVTLAMQNCEKCKQLAVSLEVIKVIPELDPGKISVITPQCPFDEMLTLRHRGDFGGRTDDYVFEWRYLPDEGGRPSAPYNEWLAFIPEPASGQGAIDITIEGPGRLTLSDNWFISRYKYTGTDLPWSDEWSDWTKSQLGEGWLKRVMGDIGPFKQRASGGGIEGAENSFFSYGDTEINTVVSMISQAGPPWTGNVPMNCKSLDDFGLLQVYETVFNRGIDFSIDGLPPVDYPPANQALLLVASRIADLYILLGNEAYADASDPTIAFGTEGQYGAEASSIHSFMNTTSSLLEEELALLRGRDDSVDPGVQVHPIYNRLVWNFSNDMTGGEVAYALNYNIQDELGNVEGTINEADAKALYPQSHGDAWGHYLTAIKTYYQLLKHPNYTWNSRSEGILIGGEPVTVDYLDERKFATAAAAKARAGAEIVNLAYRSAYVENPAGQWQGYQDIDPERAWGFSEWSSRAGQGAYFDWVVGNAILPAEDTNPNHTGIQKIDRTTVLELREVSSRYQEIQTQLDTADLGLNPLGLATNVIPFDISPGEIDAGKTHFEQIYDRSVTAMNNAITVFNHANNSTQLLRRQADSQVEFERRVEDREVDFKNRLIEIYGTPYPCDIGPGQLYPTGYDGPDLYNYTLVDSSELVGVTPSKVIKYPMILTSLDVLDNGSLKEVEKEVVFHISTSADRFGMVKPESCTGERLVQGEIQMARSDLMQSRARFERTLAEYDNLIASIEDQSELLQAQYNLNAEEINVLNKQLNQQQTLNSLIKRSRTRQLDFRTNGRMATIVANALAEFLPKSVGMATDATAPGRGGIRLGGPAMAEGMN